MKTSKKILLAAVALLTAPGAMAQQVASPDGKLKVDVSAPNGNPMYSVVYENDTVIRNSALGLETSIADMSKNLKITSAGDVKAVSESYSLPNSKKSVISYNANERVYTFANSQGAPAFDLVMHVDNNNVAFKYVVHAQQGKGNPLVSCLVNNEATTYTLPKGTTTFICPQMQPQTGFAQTAPSYETNYEFDDQMGKNGWGRGYTFPALFKETSADNSTIWVMLCETNVGGNYCGSRIECSSADSYKIAYPEAAEFGGVGTSAPGLMLRNTSNKYHQDIDDWGNATPWRTITIGKNTLAPVAETTIMWDLVKPQYEAKFDYKYGRSAWSWIIRMDGSCNYDEQKEYVDFAAAMGWEYLLVDAFWDSNIGHDRMEELSKYAQSKGVGLFLWYNSNGYWNNAFQSPRGFMHREITRRREMAWMQKAGIKGIKVDFVGSDKQQTMQMYEDILADANDYGIMVVFHGCTIPRGWERMYPNFVSCEAVRASENMAFSQYDNDIDSRSASVHPMLRNAIGNMDFGGSTLNKYYRKSNDGGSKRVTSDVFALATAILLQAPVQNFAMAPNNLTDAPAWAVDFMKKVPVKWDDMKFIDGYPGKYAVLARKSAGKWYLVAVNGDNVNKKSIEVTIPTDLFPMGSTVNVYSEDMPKNKVWDNTPTGSLKQMKIAKKPIKITVPYNGGLVICE